MRFEWNEAKSRINFTKHGLSFEVPSWCFPDHALRSWMIASTMEKNGSLPWGSSLGG
jgi:uncharacterized DUF497 family protein